MRIYLFRGLFGRVFSTGMDRLAKKLATQGHSTNVIGWLARRAIEKQILSGCVSIPTDGLALIGHSLGGNSASILANNLMDAGIEVTYVATIDATGPRAIPAGLLADSFRSWDPRTKAVSGANEFKFPDLNHIQIDKDERVHKLILDRCGVCENEHETG